MAGKNMTMNAVLKLTKSQFDKGIQQVRSSLKGLQNTFLSVSAALGAGLGLTSLVKNMKDTAVQLSVVKASLENTADSAREYAESIDFLNRIANAYGQNVNVLTQSYAKFRAAAGYAGVSLEEIRYIYEALTRAAGAYHLSAEQTQNVMVAVEQMFSKGKVTSEELRRQLGNNLPGAFGLMAKAAGKSTGEFEQLMKAGKILAKDVMPNFARILNEITENANFHSLQADLNRLSNAWIQFVNESRFGEAFEKIVAKAASALEYLATHMEGFKQTLLTLGVAIAGGLGFDKLRQKGTPVLEKLNKDIDATKAKLAQVESEIAAMSNAEFQKEFEIQAVMHQILKENQGISAEKARQIALSAVEGKTEAYADTVTKARKLTESQINNAKETQIALQRQLNILTRDGMTAMTATNKVLWGIGTTLKGIVSIVRTAFSSFIFGAILGVITAIVQRISDAVREAKELKNEYKNAYNEATKVDGRIYVQIDKAKRLVKYVVDTSLAENQRLKYLKELNTILDLQGDKMLTLKSSAEDINAEIEKWSNVKIKEAKIEGLSTAIGNYRARNAEIDALTKDYHVPTKKNGQLKTPGQMTISERKEFEEMQKLRQERTRNAKMILAFEKQIRELSAEYLEETKNLYKDAAGSNDNPNGLVPGAEGVQKAIDKYKTELSKLDNQLKRGAITQKEYDDAVDKLVVNTWREIAGFSNLDAQLKKLPKSYTEAKNAIKKDAEDVFTEKAEKELAELQEKFNDIKDDAPTLGKRDTFFDYKTTNSEKLKDQTDIIEDYAKGLEKTKEKLEEFKAKVGEKWNTEMEEYLNEIIAKLKNAQDAAETFQDAAKVAEWTEDIKKLKKELSETTYETVKNSAMSLDRLTSSIESTKRAFKDASEAGAEFSDTLDAITSTISLIFQVIDTVMSLVEGIEKAEEAYKSLNAAKATEAAITVASEKAKAAATREAAKASAMEAVAVAAATGAGVPGVGMIQAAEMEALLMGLFGSLEAYAKGGIIGGNSTSGDRQLVRANAGEMILNKTQQGNLMRMLNNGTAGGNQVEFKIRGTDLIGTIKNSESKRRG